MVLVVVLQLIAFLVAALGTWFFAYQLRMALKSGGCFFGGSHVKRERQPIAYWGLIIMLIG